MTNNSSFPVAGSRTVGPKSGNLLLRLADCFFRRRYLNLLPLALLMLTGATKVVLASNQFRSDGVMYVESSTLLASLTKARDTPATYKSPAMFATDQLGSLIRTEGFMTRVVAAAGLDKALQSGAVSMDSLRLSLAVTSEGDNLVHVSASRGDPMGALTLASATITSFRQWVIDSNVAESTGARAFLDGLVATYQKDVAAAHKVLDEYVAAHPESDPARRPLADQIEFQRLSTSANQAEARLAEAINKREDARLATEQATSDVSQRLRLVDPPTAPLYPIGSTKKAALEGVLFTMLGAVLSAVLVVAGAATDRTIRFANDVSERLRVPLLTVLPEVKS